MHNLKIREDVLNNLSLWTSLSPDFISSTIGNQEKIKKINSLLDLNIIPPSEALYRRVLHKTLLHSPINYRLKITDSVKKLRQFVRKDLIEIPHCTFVEIYLDLIRRPGALPLSWNGNKACVCLCHDVDSKECYDFIPKLVDLEKHFKVRSTYNFLTNWEYKVEHSLLKELSDNNFEVGLHGWTHDIALGCRDRKRIKNELSRALDVLGMPVKGFRAPAFSITKSLLEVLSELGIKYDSSMKTLSCYGQGVETPYPYRFPNIDIWEIPLTIQDDRIFRDLHLSCEEGLGVIKELTSRTIQVNGVTVINTHPRLVKHKFSFYKDLLDWLVRQPEIFICPMNEVIGLMGQRVNKFKEKK
jgi:peptidoglycan/xylan/chitin deacetylase (PgdA/CDA1 family)